MMRGLRRLLLISGVMLLAFAGQALAVPYPGSMVRLQAIQGSDSNFPATGDFVSNDAYWGNTGGNHDLRIVFEFANYRDRNTFGVYFGDTYRQIFSGLQGVGADGNPRPAGNQVTVDFGEVAAQLGSDVFGFYLQSPDGLFHSDTSLNLDRTDHMIAYVGSDELLLGFEDLRGGGDGDYDDMVVSIRSFLPTATAPVPEPGTILLIGSGLAGLAAMRKRKNV